jgi:hypothetical protein
VISDTEPNMLVFILSFMAAFSIDVARSFDATTSIVATTSEDIGSCDDFPELGADAEDIFSVSLLQTHLSLGGHKDVQRDLQHTGQAAAEGHLQVEQKIVNPMPSVGVSGREVKSSGTAVVLSNHMADLLSGASDSNQILERCRWTLLAVVSCVFLIVVMVIVYRPKHNKSEGTQTCDFIATDPAKDKDCEALDFRSIKNIVGLSDALKASSWNSQPPVALFTGPGKKLGDDSGDESANESETEPLLQAAMEAAEQILEEQEYSQECTRYDLAPDECLHEAGLRSYTARKQSLRICDTCGSRWMLQRHTCAYVPIAPKRQQVD